jgi:hypothetical protein
VKSFVAGLACLAGSGSLGWTQAQAELLQVKLTGSLTIVTKNGGGATTPFAGSFDVDTSVGLEHILNLTGYPDGAISNVSISVFGVSFQVLTSSTLPPILNQPAPPCSPWKIFNQARLLPSP